MKKRLIALVTTAIMLFSLGACGKETEETTTAEATTSKIESSVSETVGSEDKANDSDSSAQLAKLAEVKPNGKYKMGLALGWRDEFGSKLEAAITAEAKKLGVEIISVDASNNANTQISQIQQFSGQGLDAAIVKLVTTDMGLQVIDAAGDMPVVFVNINPVEDLSGKNATKIGSNNLEAGRLQGEFLADYFTEKGVEKVRYVMMQGTLGLSYTTERTEAAQEALKKVFPNAEKVLDVTGEYDRAKGQNQMQTFLGTAEEFDCVICNNDEMAIGVVSAMESAGLNPQEIPVVGIDGTPAGLDSMEANGISMTVYQDANGQGANAVRAAVAFANGDDVEPEINVPFLKITPDNMAEFR